MTVKDHSRSKVMKHFYLLCNGEHCVRRHPWPRRISEDTGGGGDFNFRDLEIIPSGQPRLNVIMKA